MIRTSWLNASKYIIRRIHTMGTEARKRETGGKGNSSICLKIEHCMLSWKGGRKCSKNKCRNYVEPREPKNKKK